MTITPEQLKAVAEYMGYEVRLSESCEPVTASGELCLKGTCVRYNPPKNPYQCLELMEKLKLCVVPTWEGYWTAIDFDNDDDPSYGDTINEAVTLAAIAYVESNDERD